jgi:hypothetical protein
VTPPQGVPSPEEMRELAADRLKREHAQPVPQEGALVEPRSWDYPVGGRGCPGCVP